MAIYKNSKFVKRDYECTNVVYAQAFLGQIVGESWEKTDLQNIPEDMQHLYTANEVSYFGYL